MNAVPSAAFQERRRQVLLGELVKGKRGVNEGTRFLLCITWFPSGPFSTVLTSYNIENYPLLPECSGVQPPVEVAGIPDTTRQTRACFLHSEWQYNHFIIFKVL